MIKAVLLDLDNTLIYNPDMAFARAFLACMNQYFADEGVLEDAGQYFRQAIKLMSLKARDGRETNFQRTVGIMATGGSKITSVEPTLRRFYTEAYPKLEGCIKPVDGAAAFIRKLQKEGYAVVIATNPLYNETAIRQRMAWGGLPLDDDIYAIITNAENMHFAKPDPAYYAEILGRVGVEPDEALMVGDGKHNDIEAAKQIGIHTYHTNANQFHKFIAEFDVFVANVPIIPLKSQMIDPQLRGNMGALYGLLAEVQPNFWQQRPNPDEWSILQILCHLLDSEVKNERPRLMRILNEDNPFITEQLPPGPDIDVCSEDGQDIAHSLLASRTITRKLIAEFTEQDWKRPARHSIFGLTTMLEMAYFTAQHDRLHLNQFCQTLGRCE